MPLVVLDPVGWVSNMPVLAEDMHTFETNIDTALTTHVHGQGGVVPIDVNLIPVPPGAVGNPATVKAHLFNDLIHFKPNTNVPNWFMGSFEVSSQVGENPVYVADVEFIGFDIADYKVFAVVHYPSGGKLVSLPDATQLTTEILSANSFRVHVRSVFNPYGRSKPLNIAWLAIGSSSNVGLS